jgi:hypothetical protein
MNDRDELADIIAPELPDVDIHGEVSRGIADVILAAGYRKPRIITTVEEAAALPEGTIIRSPKQGYIFELDSHRRSKPYGYSIAEETGSFIDDSYLPATVLYVPEEQK